MRPEDELDRAISEIRNETPDAAAAEQAAGRVWSKLEKSRHAALRGCADFQALLPDYRAGRLWEARALLLKDHLHECVACRKAFAGEPAPKVVSMRRGSSWAARPAFRWAVAACLALGVGLTAWEVANRWMPASGRSVVHASDGMLYQVDQQGSRPLKTGDPVPDGLEIRTGKDSGAVLLLRDGSLIELRERSGVTLSSSRRDLNVKLERGSIITQAAKRRRGHLYVNTRDCRVAVTGTVFSVDSGLKGSRVSVLEGEVRVSQGGAEQVLRPGQQMSTNPAMAPVPLRQEIAWSRDRDSHMSLLQAFSDVQKRLEQVHFAELRYASNLIGYVPENAAVYASIPNLSRPLGETLQVLRQRAMENPTLRQWWEQNKVEEILGRHRALQEYLGDEIVIWAAPGEKGFSAPVVVSEVKRSGLKEFVAGTGWQVQFYDSAAKLRSRAAGARGLAVLLGANLMALSPEPAALEQAAAWLESAPAGRFLSTPFGARIAEAYRAGTGLLLAVDLEHVPAGRGASPLAGMKHLMLEQKEVAGNTETRAVLAFNGPRTGMGSWLGKPAPMGALDFISPEANLVSAFTIRNPGAALDELLARYPKLQQELAEFEGIVGINLRADLVAPLGGEIAFAWDGPALPTPSWKLVAEVYDSNRLQWTIQRLVEVANREAAKRGKPAIRMSQETISGRTYYTLVVPEAKPVAEAHYTFANGFLIAAPSRALLDRAIQYRSTGYTLARSSGFTALLPRDQHPNFSALVYQNLGPALAPLLESLDPKQRQALGGLSGEMKATLVAAYAEDDRITFASTGNLLGLGLGNMGMFQLLERRSGEQRRGPVRMQY